MGATPARPSSGPRCVFSQSWSSPSRRRSSRLGRRWPVLRVVGEVPPPLLGLFIVETLFAEGLSHRLFETAGTDEIAVDRPAAAGPDDPVEQAGHLQILRVGHVAGLCPWFAAASRKTECAHRLTAPEALRQLPKDGYTCDLTPVAQRRQKERRANSTVCRSSQPSPSCWSCPSWLPEGTGTRA